MAGGMQPAGMACHGDGREESASAGTVELPISRLVAGPPVRQCGVDQRQVEVLAGIAERWPPILVAVPSMAVLDGNHRVEAARRLGHRTITAIPFTGSEGEAFVEAVRRNTEHGLPLTLAERKRAAARILRVDPSRSDRAVAAACGIDHKTAGRVRRTLGAGARRPPDGGAGCPGGASDLRLRIAAVIAEHPDESLRRIAMRIGASPETVRTVRRTMSGRDGGTARPGRGSPPDLPLAAFPATGTAPSAPARLPPSPPWTTDAACASEPDRAAFARWFDDAAGAAEWLRHVQDVPLSRVYEVAAQARAYADCWRGFADALESRARQEGCVRQ